MARNAASLAIRLQKLKAALPKAQACNGRKLAAQPMRKLLGVSWKVLREWCDDLPGFDESGAFTRGGNGIQWEFAPVKTVRFLIKYFEAEHRRHVDRAKATRRMVGGNELDGLPEDFDLEQIRKTIQIAGMLREEKQRGGALVDAARADQAIRAMMARMQQAGVTSASAQDPTGQWPAHIRESFEDAVSNVLVEMAQAGEECLRLFGGGTSQPGQAQA